MKKHTFHKKGEIRPALVKQLTEATEEILLAIGWLDDVGLLGLFQKKVLEGVVVHLILVEELGDANYMENFTLLAKKGVRITWLDVAHQEHLTDHKYGIIDKSIVLTGNYNWGYKTAPQKESLTISETIPTLVQGFLTEFEYLEIYPQLPKNESRPENPILALLKKMDVLRVLIAIDDTEFIHLRLQELETYQNDSNVAIILKNLLDKNFEEAQDLMKNFIKKHRPLRVCIEPPIDNLRREIQRLEEEIAATSREYSETQKTLEEFSQLHTEALGDLLQKILLQSKLKAKIEAQENADKKAEFEEANQDYEEYTKSHEEAKQQQQPTVLTKEEKKELKKLYRRTSLQCHPDRVVEELHQEAEELFVELNKAYKANDLVRLREISEQLKTGSMLSKSESITELKKLESTVHSLTQKLKDWEAKLDKLKAKPTYQKVFDIDDWEVYFSETKVLLESQLERLEAFIAAAEKPNSQPTFLIE